MKQSVLNLAICAAIVSNQCADAMNDKTQAWCGAFLTKVCYPLDLVLEQTMKYPADFSIDEVELRNGPRVTLYEGIGLSEQDGVRNLKKAKSLQEPSGKVDIYTGLSNFGTYFDVHFEPYDKHWGVLQVFGYVKSHGDAAKAAKFISELHPCTREQLSVICRAGMPLQEAGTFVASLKTSNAKTGSKAR